MQVGVLLDQTVKSLQFICLGSTSVLSDDTYVSVPCLNVVMILLNLL
jgi:hypothetical protein